MRLIEIWQVLLASLMLVAVAVFIMNKGRPLWVASLITILTIIEAILCLSEGGFEPVQIAQWVFTVLGLTLFLVFLLKDQDDD